MLLPFEPEAALKNFDELEQMQMTGRCGFYEAADFSPERVDGQEYALVRSYMAHHVGMSMVSVCNALKGYAMQNRFMRDDRMAAARCLLEEKIPTGASVFHDVELRETPQRAQRVTSATREIMEPNPVQPQMHLLTNGEWSVAVSDCGTSVSLYRESDITWRGGDLLRRPKGILLLHAHKRRRSHSAVRLITAAGRSLAHSFHTRKRASRPGAKRSWGKRLFRCIRACLVSIDGIR